jgi:hypothetical protein
VSLAGSVKRLGISVLGLAADRHDIFV